MYDRLPRYLRGDMGYGFAIGLLYGGILFAVLLWLMGYSCSR